MLLLGPARLLNDPTKFPESEFFSRIQQRSFRVQDPVIAALEILQFSLTAAKKFAQQSFRPVAIDRLANGLGRCRDTEAMLSPVVYSQKSGQQTAVISLPLGRSE